MTITAKTMEWLDQNRYRSYPMDRARWREYVEPESGLDCVVLDALVFDSDASGTEGLFVNSIRVTDDNTSVELKYGNNIFNVDLVGGAKSGAGSFDGRRYVINGSGMRPASISLSLSSHAYIHDRVGEGIWNIGCPVIKSRIIGLSKGMGVDGILSNGSYRVPDHGEPSIASGDVVLEDGYRTSPIINRGKILVRVGTRYGLDPCTYDYSEGYQVDCRKPMFFFCGQNAVNGGNIVIKGGEGINVTQGKEYKMRTGPFSGRSIPCVEIIAGKELLDIYSPASGS